MSCYLKKSGKKVLVCLLAAVIMTASMIPLNKALAANTPIKWVSCINDPVNDATFGVNAADSCSKNVFMGTTVYMSGWCLSNIKISSYTIECNSGSKVIKDGANIGWNRFPFPKGYVASQNKKYGTIFTDSNSGWCATVDTSKLSTGVWYVSINGHYVYNNKEYLVPVASIKLTVEYRGKALIYQLEGDSDSKSAAENVKTYLESMGYYCEKPVLVGRKAPAGTTAETILNKMANYDIVFINCHGGASMASGKSGRILFYEDDGKGNKIFVSAEDVARWKGSLSKNKLVFMAVCDAGCTLNDTMDSVADLFVKKGAKAVVCSERRIWPKAMTAMSFFFFQQLRNYGDDSFETMEKCYKDMMQYLYECQKNSAKNSDYKNQVLEAMRFVSKSVRYSGGEKLAGNTRSKYRYYPKE